MKSILFVLDYYIPHRGGVENVFENIIKRLDKAGYNIFVLTSKFSSKLADFEEIRNVKIYRVGKGRLSFMAKSIGLGKKILRENEIDVIHGSTYGGAIPASILGKKINKKVILTVHEIFGKLRYKYKGILKGLIYKVFEKIIFIHKYDIYHCVSHNTEKELIHEYKIDKSKVHVIHNGVDYDFWNPNNVKQFEVKSLRIRQSRGDKFIFLYFGHAGKSKGIDYLVKALPELSKLDNVQILFNIIESKRTQKILDKINRVKSPNIQVFKGMKKEDLRLLVATCDCVIAPSLSEGFGSVHTESCAMGKILITSRISAIPEVVSGKIRFIKPYSSTEIVQAAKDVIEGKYDQIPTKTFDRDKTVMQIEKLY